MHRVLCLFFSSCAYMCLVTAALPPGITIQFDGALGLPFILRRTATHPVAPGHGEAYTGILFSFL